MFMSDESDYNELLNYIPYATDAQERYINEVVSTGSISKAAKSLSVNYTTVSRSIERVKKNAALRGYSPDHNLDNPTPEGFHIAKTATMYRDPDPNSTTPIKWVSTNMDRVSQYETMREAAEAFKEDLPKYTPVKKKNKAKARDDLLNLFVLTDYHLGMYSWHEETGENWNIEKAEEMLYRWIDHSVDVSSNATTAVFAQLGDLLHWDGLDAVTPMNRHVLDADTRFQMVVRVAIRAIRYIMKRLLEKHDHVHVIMADANHDPAGGVWMREWVDSVYQDEPRVTVDTSADTYYAYEFGNTALFFHHGHKKRINQVAPVFTRKFRKIYGNVKYAYAHTGHLHHYEASEKNNLMKVEQHRCLAPKDAYASRAGFESDRDAHLITYSSKYGQVSDMSITPQMLMDDDD